jgi:hypothetical protein
MRSVGATGHSGCCAKTLGTAVAKPNANAWPVGRVGDAFVFNVLDHIDITDQLTITSAVWA